jgi:hypothetical protein
MEHCGAIGATKNAANVLALEQTSACTVLVMHSQLRMATALRSAGLECTAGLGGATRATPNAVPTARHGAAVEGRALDAAMSNLATVATKNALV